MKLYDYKEQHIFSYKVSWRERLTILFTGNAHVNIPIEKPEVEQGRIVNMNPTLEPPEDKSKPHI